MNQKNFHLQSAQKFNERKFICVGLDTVYEKIPDCIRTNDIRESIFNFNREIIDATYDLVHSYKPNSAFYEAHGPLGLQALGDTFDYINADVQNVLGICDVKRGDIGNTNSGYTRSNFDWLRADAITINPYLGSEANEPFLKYSQKGIIVLCRTSNEGADEIQELLLANGNKVYEQVALLVNSQKWNYNSNCLIVVGATSPQQLKRVRELVGDMTILVPGVGKQGGTIYEVLANGLNSRRDGLIINSSRDVIYASSGADFAEAARAKVIQMNAEIHQYLDLAA